MYIYNVTINIDESVHSKWLEWMKTKHINDVLATKKFTSARLVRVLVEEEMGGMTYSVQYFAPSKQHLDEYYQQYADALRQEGLQLFGDKMLAFRTELEIISEH
ncbi:DUF4286 family protein [Avrilella dinanensis]|uniref:DUF4286 family protein n=1 Tax=Avrilella dinanensis TaxID=2008672 RepID=UPI00240A08BA|nr:DUF4286 family protein [Avrilella dinanensis]